MVSTLQANDYVALRSIATNALNEAAAVAVAANVWDRRSRDTSRQRFRSVLSAANRKRRIAAAVLTIEIPDDRACIAPTGLRTTLPIGDQDSRLITFGPGDNRGVKTSIVEGLVHPKPFVATDDGIAAGEPTECFNPITVVMRAEALSRKEGHVGAVAFGHG